MKTSLQFYDDDVEIDFKLRGKCHYAEKTLADDGLNTTLNEFISLKWD